MDLESDWGRLQMSDYDYTEFGVDDYDYSWFKNHDCDYSGMIVITVGWLPLQWDDCGYSGMIMITIMIIIQWSLPGFPAL